MLSRITLRFFYLQQNADLSLINIVQVVSIYKNQKYIFTLQDWLSSIQIKVLQLITTKCLFPLTNAEF
jgi:hypothetical protein